MNRHLAIAAVLGLVGLVALAWVSASNPTGAAEASGRGELVQVGAERDVTRFAPDPAIPPDRPVPQPGPEAAVPTPSDPSWPELHGRFRKVMGERIQVVVPDDATRFEAHDLEMDAIDLRSSDLDALIVDLTALAETTSDEATRVDALVSLGEVYLELDGTLSETPIPDWMKPRRAQRLQADLDRRRAVALDKARMVFEMARSAGPSAQTAEMAGRIHDGLAAAE